MNYKFGLLYATGLNLGDDMQGEIVRTFLPQIDSYYDGCFLDRAKSDKPIKLAIHGRFDSHMRGWPPSPDIKPLFISFALGEYALKQVLSKESIAYFKQHGPVGCRDYYTRDLLHKHGVNTYFSGCVTLTLPPSQEKRTDEIILTDLDPTVVQHLPSNILEQATVLRHGSGIPWERISDRLRGISPQVYNLTKRTKVHIALGAAQQWWVKQTETEQKIKDRFKASRDLINRYSKAKLVITSRLHATLPNLALGTPVIFVPRDLTYVRFTGLLQYVNAIQANQFKDKIKSYDLDSPPPNPKPVDELRNALTRDLKNFFKETE